MRSRIGSVFCNSMAASSITLWMVSIAYTLHHYRDKDQDEVDIIVEDEHGALVGIEVKASATVHASDFKGMRKLLDICGDDLKLGLVLYDGTKVVPFGD